jgi:hypothetical protein
MEAEGSGQNQGKTSKRARENKAYTDKKKLELSALHAKITELEAVISDFERPLLTALPVQIEPHRLTDLKDANREWGLGILSERAQKELAFHAYQDSTSGSIYATYQNAAPLVALEAELKLAYGESLVLIGTSATGGEALTLALSLALELQHIRRNGKKKAFAIPKSPIVGAFDQDLHTGHKCVTLPENVMKKHGTEYQLPKPKIQIIDSKNTLRYPDLQSAIQGRDLTLSEKDVLRRCTIVYFDLLSIWNVNGPSMLSMRAVVTALEICRESNIITVCDCIPTGLGVTGKPLCASHYGMVGFDVLVLGKGHGMGIVVGQWATEVAEGQLRKLQYDMHTWSTSLGYSSQIYFAVHALRFYQDRILSAYDEFNIFKRNLKVHNGDVKFQGLLYWVPKNHKINQLRFGLGRRGLWAIDFKASEVMNAFDKELAAATSECVECNALKEKEVVIKCHDCPFYFHTSCADFEAGRCQNCFVRFNTEI